MSWSRPFQVLLVLALVMTSLVPRGAALAQPQQGATMTVLRGQVALIHEDGSAIQPAPSGTTVTIGDEIRTLSPGGALITFFNGIEIELGPETNIQIGGIYTEGNRVNVSISQLVGTTVSRIESFTDPKSSYRIESGGAVAMIRGSTIAMRGPENTPTGNFAAAVCFDCGPTDYIEEVPVDDEEVFDDEDRALAPADQDAGLALGWPADSSSGMFRPSSRPRVDASRAFEDAFWQELGFPVRTSIDGFARLPLGAGETGVAALPGTATEDVGAKLSNRDRRQLGDISRRSFGYTWKATAVKKNSSGRITRVRVQVKERSTGRVKYVWISRREWEKLDEFVPRKVDRAFHPATLAADLITEASQDEQSGDSPGSNAAGNQTTASRASTAREIANREDNNTKDGPVASSSPVPVSTLFPTLTTINCNPNPFAPNFMCIAYVHRNVNPLIPPRPQGTITFSIIGGSASLSPTTCTLSQFDDDLISSCFTNVQVTGGSAVIQAVYTPSDGTWAPSQDSLLVT